MTALVVAGSGTAGSGAALKAAAIFGATGVAAGAFGAHGLKEQLDPAMLEVFRTGAHYQMIHALALLGLAAWSRACAVSVSRVAWLWIFGVVVFSGSLYVLALSGVRWLGAITPIGGASLIAGWAALLWTGWKERT